MRSLVLEANTQISKQLIEHLHNLNIFDNTIISDINDLDYKVHNDFDLVFIDYNLNHEDPFELAFQLQKANPDTYIVFLTSFKNNEAEVFENYDIEYILKPINPHRLKTVVQKAKCFKHKPVERFIGDVSVKMFGSMELKMNSRNVRIVRKRQKEIIAYLILHQFKASAVDMAKDIMNDKEFAYSIHELKALIYELRQDIRIVDEYIKIEYIDQEYHLICDEVNIDYHEFMSLDANKMSMHRLELSLITYGKGLLYNFHNEWYLKSAYNAKKHFFHLQHSLIHSLEERKDTDKLRNILFNLKQYLETEEDWDYFNHIVEHNFSKVQQEHFQMTN